MRAGERLYRVECHFDLSVPVSVVKTIVGDGFTNPLAFSLDLYHNGLYAIVVP